MKARVWVRTGVAAAAVLAGALTFAWWYLVKCEGSWQGVPLETPRAAELPQIEANIRATVRHLSVDIGERNLRDETRHQALQQAGEWIRQRWEAQGYRVAEQSLVVDGKEVSNLEIEIPGRKVPAEIVIVSAQHDTLPGSPGANNNASGEAVLLELSRLLRGCAPDRTIRLVSFTTEEDPWFGTENMGSYHYACRSRDRREDIRAMLSLDSIGFYLHGPGTQRLPFPFSLFYPDRGDFLAFIGNIKSRAEVVRATRGFRMGSAFPIRAGLAPEWVEGTSWSDHASFWHFGYPGIQVTDTGGFRSPFHTSPADTFEKLDYPALARIAFGIYGSVLVLSTAGSTAPLWDSARVLLANGALVLAIGVLCGVPFYLAIIRNWLPDRVRVWRVAHATLIMDGLLLLAAGILSPSLSLGGLPRAVLAWCLVVSGWSFVFALAGGAWAGRRGLRPQPWGMETVFFAGHAVGALGSLGGVALLVAGLLG
jgi:hypothetical protein